MSAVVALYHVVFSTKYRKNTIPEGSDSELYRMITHRIKERGSKLLSINGIGNHLHFLLNLHPSTALSDLIKDLKQSTSIWMSRSEKFPGFQGWGREYFAHSVSDRDAAAVKQYIASQKEHHRKIVFEEELKILVKHVGLTWHDNILS